ncbi:dihydrofolate reductase family protein [Rhizobium phaseoli]|uniref:Putative dihydrofolate reductase protein n=1 Tax=Rhizobium etli (strain CIAT 652) TaxID=491916 RepID=B3Q496_RHIE6|nr:dihydrofolate reductase family protein [Rhizobium phaseoli]ACE94900.1 putative dihydrofolate reductase protein [Rhizobium etli CIAT 652]MDH6645732.1 dihydrofolate reductase [Rhizobium esperanzae]PCD64147.1 dihydrofolate reductase [Rhizobium phaseoli]
MKKLIVSNWVSLDGYIAGPNGALDWIFGDGRLAQYETELMAQADTILSGRRTYEQLSQYWSAVPNNPQAMDWERRYADMINAAHHIVVSHDLQKAPWGNSTIWPSIEQRALDALKAGSDKAILIFGSATVVQSLTNLGAVDEFHLLVHPVLLGGGTRLFEEVDVRMNLRRVDVEAFDSGIVKMVYQRG